MILSYKAKQASLLLDLIGGPTYHFCRASVIAATILAATFSNIKAEVDFQKDVRLILSDKCYSCHGPGATSRKADLRLDLDSDHGKTSDSGLKILVPGDPDKSEIIARIESKDPDDVMPPSDSNTSLTEDEKRILRQWVKEGGKYDVHWAFKSVVKPDIPKVSNKHSSLIANPIDSFILRDLEEINLSYEPAAGRERLLRRLSFDLTGLPPQPNEIETFIMDQSPDFYEKKVEELLKRESHGERLTSEWLDVARYSDTYGYQVDRDRYVWPWKDWVIKQFNENLPYDKFILYQLAGDLLPNASRDQILATTFNRLHPQKVEGGSVPEEFRIEYVSDRTHTVGTAFLGLTFECARCHDHKYDPLSKKEYYQMTSFFDNIDEAGLYSYFTSSIPTPTLMLTDKDISSKIDKLEQQIQGLERKFKKRSTEEDFLKLFNNWKSEAPSMKLSPSPIAAFDFEKLEGGKLKNSISKDKPASTGGANKIVEGNKGMAIKLTGDDAVKLPVGNFKRSQPFSITLDLLIPEKFERSVVFHRSRAWTDAGSRGYEFLLVDGKARFSLIHFWPGNAISIESEDEIPIGKWISMAFTYDGSAKASGLGIYLDGKPLLYKTLYDNLYKNMTGGGGDNIAIGERFRDVGFKNGLVDNFNVYQKKLSNIEILKLQNPTVSDANGHKALVEYFQWNVDETSLKILADLKTQRENLHNTQNGIQEIMVMKESTRPKQTFDLERGTYSEKTTPVNSLVPGFIPPALEKNNLSRLDLARWLTDRKNPLTARVTVNRYWQLIFGEGLVSTSEDFGLQGSPPTHPELLDWLASEFMDRQWDLRWLLREMVTSNAYRQRSSTPPDKLKKDPQNRFYSRGKSYRLAAEMIRDNALAASGLLVNKVGGPPVKPYEVEQSFKKANRQKGESLYRRSLYTWWKRTGPAPTMLALDASKRDVCTVRRERTATPIHAFIFLNDPQFVEAAKMLANRFYKKEGGNVSESLSKIFMTLTSRNPTRNEQRILEEMHEAQVKIFSENSKEMEDYLNVGDTKFEIKEFKKPTEFTALAVVANALFAHDECIMKK